MNPQKKPTKRSVQILIVEDSRTQAEQLRYLLEEHSYEVTVAANGRDALAAVTQQPPVLIISDIVMPEMDGFTLCEKIKADEKLKTIPVVLLTSLTGPQDVIRGLQCGADSFIRKPYDENYLLSRVRHILTNQELRQNERMQMGVELYLGGQRYFITSERQQVLDLLISTYEEAFHINEELKQRQRDLAYSYQWLNGLYHVAEGLNTSTSEQAVAEEALQRCLALPGVQAAWLSLLDEEGGLRLSATGGLPPALSGSTGSLADCLSCRRLVQENLTQAVNRDDCEALQQAAVEACGLRAHATIPLWSGGRMLGILNLIGPEQGQFSEQDLRMLSAVGNQIGVTLERARLYEQLEKKVEEKTAALRAEVIDRQQIAEALRQSEERYRTLVANIPDVTWVADSNNRITFISPNVEKVQGFTPAEIYQSNQTFWLSRIHPDDLDHLRKSFALLFTQNQPFDTEFRFRRKDDVWIWLHARALSMFEESGAVYAYGVFSDITEHKKLEQQLYQAQKMEAVGRLAGGMAHDFNNILTIITGFSDLMLLRLTEHDPLRRNAEQIRKAADRAAGLTRQLLAFSRQQVLQPKAVNLNTIVADVKKMLQRLIGEDIEMVFVPGPALGQVKVDPGQIEQVIMNLAINARDAMPQGGKLTIETANIELGEDYASSHLGSRAGSYVMLAITDTGCGMDSETQSRIFEPFYTTKEPGKGTGLGLSTVYGIVKQSGGYIWVYSEVGQGTTFKVYLPRVDEPVVSTEPTKHRAESLRGKETILLVEDEDMVRALIHQVLQLHGYTVLAADGAAEALALSERHQGTIDLLLTDTVMPAMSGRVLAERLAAARPTMKVIYMSGYTDDAVVRHGVLEADLPFLQKPFSPQVVVSKIREVLDR